MRRIFRRPLSQRATRFLRDRAQRVESAEDPRSLMDTECLGAIKECPEIREWTNVD